MQRKEIAAVINAHFSCIKALTRKVIVHFDSQLVRELRVEIKKLRAFLDLLHTEKPKDELKIHRRLKSFNGYIGIIRNIQLQEHLMQEMACCTVATYFQQLHAEAQEWKKEAIKLTLDHTNFDEERDKILDSLPDKLSKTTIHKFLWQKIDVIESLPTLQHIKEDNLHALRKALKDILYAWPYIRYEAAEALPPEMNSPRKLKKLTGLLGNYGDQCTALDLLQPTYIEKVQDPQERELLHEACKRFEETRDELKRRIVRELLSLKPGKQQGIDAYQYTH